MAAYHHKNQRNNVEEISAISKPFIKIRLNLPRIFVSLMEGIYHRLADFIMSTLECTLSHGVDILS